MDEASVLSNIVARDAPDAVKAALAQAIRGTASIAEDVALLEENRLWVGNWRSVQLLEQLKCQAVLNCALAVETPTVVACDAFLRLSMPDAPHPALDVRPFLRDGAKFIDEQHKLKPLRVGALFGRPKPKHFGVRGVSDFVSRMGRRKGHGFRRFAAEYLFDQSCVQTSLTHVVISFFAPLCFSRSDGPSLNTQQANVAFYCSPKIFSLAE
jgi:hypothetical protein